MPTPPKFELQKFSRRPLKMLPVVFIAAVGAAVCSAGRPPAQPPVPTWPEQFTVELEILVEQYGPNWNSSGALYYDWMSKTFRSDYIGWCLPLFGSSLTNEPPSSNYYSCSFLATEGSMFFVNHTANAWKDNECCLFAEGLGCIAPDWMSNCQYNGTATVQGVECDVWWFPGTSDPNKPCYGYWDSTNKIHSPVRFFGLSSLGPTILNYSHFQVGPVPSNVSLALPNRDGCFKECQPSLLKHMSGKSPPISPHFPWPSCG